MAPPKLILLSLTVASSLLATAPAMADWKTKQVRHADLDLSSPAGRERLQLRIKQAVKQVCGSPRSFTITERQDQRACEQDAIKRAAPEGERIIAAYMEKRRLAFDGTPRAGAN
jgi:UrcA family protein